MGDVHAIGVGVDAQRIEGETTSVAQDDEHFSDSDDAARAKFGDGSRVDSTSINITAPACAVSRENRDDIRVRMHYLDGPIAVRLSSLTFVVDAFCERLRDATISIDACMMRDVIQAIMRACRDSAPNVALRARTGVFRILQACLEREPLDARAAATALKSVVFVGAEHSACTTAHAHIKSECVRILDSRHCDEYTGNLLRMMIDGRYRDCAHTLRPATKPKPSTKKLANRRLRHDLQVAKLRRQKADERRAEEIRRRGLEEEQRARRLEIAAANARNTILQNRIDAPCIKRTT